MHITFNQTSNKVTFLKLFYIEIADQRILLISVEHNFQYTLQILAFLISIYICEATMPEPTRHVGLHTFEYIGICRWKGAMIQYIGL